MVLLKYSVVAIVVRYCQMTKIMCIDLGFAEDASGRMP